MAGGASTTIPDGRPLEDERFHKFCATTVHHLNEPVRMIGIYVDMLEASAGSQLNGEALQSIEYLRGAAKQMQMLQDGLAEFASATGKATRPHSAIRLELPLRQALLNLNDEVKAANGAVIYENLPTVYGDFDGLRLLFEHLLKNGVRYCFNGKPEISVTAKSSGHEWVIAVRDNGAGIEPAFQEKIFELYTRLHGKSLPGNGLGLPICKAVVARHGGKIWLESKPGEGSCFCFTLPAREF